MTLTQTVLNLAAHAAAPFGVSRFGCCRLEALSRLLPCRGRDGLPQAGSVLVVLLPFYAGEFPGRNVARYALCDDYHLIAGDILQTIAHSLSQAFPGQFFRCFADNSPIPEVEAGCLAGLGFAGRNGQLITPDYGSYAFVGELVTDLALEPTGSPLPAGSCGDCRRCWEACPTGALSPRGLNPALCRSHITQKKGALTPEEARQVALGGLAWGCDICTGVCPHNRAPVLTPILRMRENLIPVLTPENLTALLPHKSYGWRGAGVLRRNLALVAAAPDATAAFTLQ